MDFKKAGVAVAALAAAGALVAAAANANADPNTAPAASRTYSPDYGGRPASNDTPVTGDELAKVTAAVTGKDSSVTVTSVQKDPDGSYDVFGTKAGAQVMFDVNADLATITQNANGGGHGPGGSYGSAGPSASQT
ncbi:MAG: hypothetical protein ACOYBY_19275 [Dermatophilaceae bacterium]